MQIFVPIIVAKSVSKKQVKAKPVKRSSPKSAKKAQPKSAKKADKKAPAKKTGSKKAIKQANVSEWWKSKTDSAKRVYLALHPKSKYAKMVKAKLIAAPKEATPEEAKEEAKQISAEAPVDSLQDATPAVEETKESPEESPAGAEPEDTLEKDDKEHEKGTNFSRHTKPGRSLVGRTLEHVKNKTMYAVKTKQHDYKRAMSGLRAFKEGGASAMTDLQKDALKKTAITVAKVALGVALLAGFAFGVGHLATELGTYFHEKYIAGSLEEFASRSSDDNKDDDKELDGYVSTFLTWMKAQDPDKLRIILENRKAQEAKAHADKFSA